MGENCPGGNFINSIGATQGNVILILYRGTPLVRSPVGQKHLAVLTGWPNYWGRVKFHELTAVMTNTGRTFHRWRLTGDGWRVAGDGNQVTGIKI